MTEPNEQLQEGGENSRPSFFSATRGKRELIAAVAEILRLEDGALIWFGNREGEDLDLVALTDRGGGLDWCHGAIDLLVLRREQFLRLVQLSDPIATEPIRTGELVAGEERVWQAVRELFRSIKAPHPDAPQHLLRRGLAQYHSALQWLERHSDTGDPCHAGFGLLNLSFFCSYFLSAREASAGRLPPSMSDLLPKYSQLRTIREAFSLLKRGGEISSVELREMILGAEALLLGKVWTETTG